MARWRGGAVARWRGGAVARWRGGAVARWRGGAVARWRGGAVARWRGGAVARWRGGAVARWRRGAVAPWRGGAVARWRGGAVARWRGGAVARWRGGAVRGGAVARTSDSRLIISKARKRVNMIYQLKRAGINQNDLIRIHVSVIRPVVKYACPVWHTNLPKYLSDKIEIIKKGVSKLYFQVISTKISCRW